jgi:hypothetical protein
MQHVSNIQYGYLLNKYLKCSVWRLAVRYDIHIYIYIYIVRRQRINVVFYPKIKWEQQNKTMEFVAKQSHGLHVLQSGIYRLEIKGGVWKTNMIYNFSLSSAAIILNTRMPVNIVMSYIHSRANKCI